MEEFWRKLVQIVYPFKYKDVYNYKKLYKGHIIHTYKTRDSKYDYGIEEEYIKFSFDELFQKYGMLDYDKYLTPVIHLGMVNYLDLMFIAYYNSFSTGFDTWKTLLINNFYTEAANKNMTFIGNLLSLVISNPKYGPNPIWGPGIFVRMEDLLTDNYHIYLDYIL